MKCARAEELFSAALDGRLSTRVERDLRQHLVHCGACAASYEELEASLAFDRDPLHCAIEAVFGRAGSSAAPLCEEAEGARTVVIGLGHWWAAVLTSAEEQAIAAWHDEISPRRAALLRGFASSPAPGSRQHPRSVGLRAS